MHILILLTTSSCPHCVPVVNNVWPDLKLRLNNIVRLMHINMSNMMTVPPDVNPGISNFVRWVPAFVLLNDDSWDNNGSLLGILFNGNNINGNFILDRIPMPQTEDNVYDWVIDNINNNEIFLPFESIKISTIRTDRIDLIIEISNKCKLLLNMCDEIAMYYISVLTRHDKVFILNAIRQIKKLDKSNDSIEKHKDEVNEMFKSVSDLFNKYKRLEKCVNTIKSKFIEKLYAPPSNLTDKGGSGYIKSLNNFNNLLSIN